MPNPVPSPSPSFRFRPRSRSRQRLNARLAARGITPGVLDHAELLLRLRRLPRLAADATFARDLHETARRDVPARSEDSAWPGQIEELADKIAREPYTYVGGGLRPFERPVTDKDRRLLLSGLPRGIVVEMDDPRH